MHVLSASEKHNIELSAEAAHPMQGPSWVGEQDLNVYLSKFDKKLLAHIQGPGHLAEGAFPALP